MLLVEDEKAILSLCQASLRRFGYQVLAARNPEEALQLARQHENSLHLLISDMVLPGMNGRDLVRASQEAAAARQGAVYLRILPRCDRRARDVG